MYAQEGIVQTRLCYGLGADASLLPLCDDGSLCLCVTMVLFASLIMVFFHSSTEVRVADSRSLAANVVLCLAPLLGRYEDVGHCAGPI
jgi:hypothetical protein